VPPPSGSAAKQAMGLTGRHLNQEKAAAIRLLCRKLM